MPQFPINQILPPIKRESFINNHSINKLTKSLFFHLEDLCTKNNKNRMVIVNGGFAVDLAVGRLTRNHDDLDLVVLEKNLLYYKNTYQTKSWDVGCYSSNNPTFSFYVKNNDLDIDFDSIRISGLDVSDQGDLGGERWTWPIKADKLFWKRTIGHVEYIFLSPYLIYDFKKRQQKRSITRNKETSDFKYLKKLFPDIAKKYN